MNLAVVYLRNCQSQLINLRQFDGQPTVKLGRQRGFVTTEIGMPQPRVSSLQENWGKQ
jgi:hypothetical protein